MRTPRYLLVVLGLTGVLSIAGAAQQRPPGGNPPLPPGSTSVGNLTAEQDAAFDRGRQTFNRRYEVADGLGPVFNDDSCNACHRGGTGSNDTVRRIGRVDSRGAYDPLIDLGGSLLQSRGIGSTTTSAGTHTFTGERVPATATLAVLRRAHAVQGLGFVDAVPDDTWQALAASQAAADPSTAGRVNMVINHSAGRLAVGKFGWKAQVASLVDFSADALLNEMGITNPIFRTEVCPQGNCRALDFNPVASLNDDGRAVDELNNFMTLLAAPARGASSNAVVAGEQVFNQAGCAACHVATLRTGPSTVAALNRVDFHPYSDYLLHDMDSLGDGVEQGTATGREMRTQPLWGLRTATSFLHDGASLTIEDAIRRHDGQGRASRDRFVALDADRLAQLLAFLRSL